MLSFRLPTTVTQCRADMPLTQLENELRARARTLIEQGALPAHSPSSTYGGYGSGGRCSLCGVPIARTEVEYEVAYGNDAYRFHFMCHAAWQLEQARREHLSNTARSQAKG